MTKIVCFKTLFLYLFGRGEEGSHSYFSHFLILLLSRTSSTHLQAKRSVAPTKVALSDGSHSSSLPPSLLRGEDRDEEDVHAKTRRKMSLYTKKPPAWPGMGCRWKVCVNSMGLSNWLSICNSIRLSFSLFICLYLIYHCYYHYLYLFYEYIYIKFGYSHIFINMYIDIPRGFQ